MYYKFEKYNNYNTYEQKHRKCLKIDLKISNAFNSHSWYGYYKLEKSNHNKPRVYSMIFIFFIIYTFLSFFISIPFKDIKTF